MDNRMDFERHKKAFYYESSELKVVYKTLRKDYNFFKYLKIQIILSLWHLKICGLISPLAVSDSVKCSAQIHAPNHFQVIGVV